ncbi:hypothetical protein BaRGS_00024717 [Batillaria attramentaria]|uniref:Uncharacterized protein n=1 Tax=Batillaria attramentaria TaxID=370345 RepID=A0ABD0KAF8_9CAEN
MTPLARPRENLLRQKALQRKAVNCGRYKSHSQSCRTIAVTDEPSLYLCRNAAGKYREVRQRDVPRVVKPGTKMASPAESSATDPEAASENGAAAAEEVDGRESENFQGPHKWRQHLRHVKVPKFGKDDNSADITDTEERESASDRCIGWGVKEAAETSMSYHEFGAFCVESDIDLGHQVRDLKEWAVESETVVAL